MPWFIRSVQYHSSERNGWQAQHPEFPWVFYTSRFLEGAKKFSTACHEIFPPFLFWLPAFSPAPLKRVPARERYMSRAPAVPCRTGNWAKWSRMEPVTVGDRDRPPSQRAPSSPWCSKGISGVPQTHQIFFHKSRCWKSWRYCWLERATAPKKANPRWNFH